MILYVSTNNMFEARVAQGRTNKSKVTKIFSPYLQQIVHSYCERNSELRLGLLDFFSLFNVFILLNLPSEIDVRPNHIQPSHNKYANDGWLKPNRKSTRVPVGEFVWKRRGALWMRGRIRLKYDWARERNKLLKWK